MKKQKFEPVLISSKEGLESKVADLVTLKCKYAEVEARKAQDLAAVERRYQSEQVDLASSIETLECGIQVYCLRNRKDLFTEKKSLDLVLATVGFRTNPPSVELIKSKDSFKKAAMRVFNTEWGEDYVRLGDPALNKERILEDNLDAEQLMEVGLTISQEEEFFIKPKQEIADMTVSKGAA